MNNKIIKDFNEEIQDELKINLSISDKSNDIIIVSLSGCIDTYNGSFFDKKVNIILKNYSKIIFDFSEIIYVSSTGIGSLTNFLEKSKLKNGNIILMNVQPKVYEVFKMLGFSKYFSFANSLDEANNFFKQSFPISILCSSCKKKLKIPRLGKYKCPKCKYFFYINKEGFTSTSGV